MTAGKADLSSLQRRQIAEVFGRKKMSVVVVTDDSIARYITTALTWLGVDIKAFRWEDMRQAVQHLGEPDAHGEHLIEIIDELKRACLPQR